MTLGGFVPSEVARTEIAAFAKERFGSAGAVTDTMKVASGAPEGMLRAVGVAFAALGKLTSGAVSLADARVSLTGEAQFADLAREAQTLIEEKLPPGFSGTSSISVAQAPDGAGDDGADAASAGGARACQERLNAITSGKVVRFEVGSTSVSAQSYALLEQIAAAAQECRDFTIEVGGHTDSDGPADFNQELSERRARSVVDFLVERGVARARLKAVGYGEEKPIASNDNEAGKARNRRIEFTILG